MKRIASAMMAASLLGTAATATAMTKDDPLLVMGKLEQLEVRKADGSDPIVAEGYAWIGYDLNKLWLKLDAEKVGSEVHELETQLLYSRAIAPYWDFQIGWRRDHKPEDQKRDWLAIGLNGVAPFFFEVDAQAFVGENGQLAARLKGEYELMFTQKLVLIPEATVNVHAKNDPAIGVGSGVSDITAGARLAYHFTREFAPYVGVNWTRKFGQTADYARDDGESVKDTQLVIGIRAWF